MTIGERIQQARKVKNWSQRKLAIMAGTSNASVSRWEISQREMTAGNIISVCYALNVSPNWLLTGDEKFNSPNSTQALNVSPNWLLTGDEKFNSPNSTQALKACFEIIGRYDSLEKRVKALEDRRGQ